MEVYIIVDMMKTTVVFDQPVDYPPVLLCTVDGHRFYYVARGARGTKHMERTVNVALNTMISLHIPTDAKIVWARSGKPPRRHVHEKQMRLL